MTHSNPIKTLTFSGPVRNFITLCAIPLIGWVVINFFLRLLNNPFLFCSFWIIVTLTGITADNIQSRSYRLQSPCQKHCACKTSHSILASSSDQGEMDKDGHCQVPDVGTQTPQVENKEAKPIVNSSEDEEASWIIVPENEKFQENVKNCINAHQNFKDDAEKVKQPGPGKKEDIRIDCFSSEEKPNGDKTQE